MFCNLHFRGCQSISELDELEISTHVPPSISMKWSNSTNSEMDWQSRNWRFFKLFVSNQSIVISLWKVWLGFTHLSPIPRLPVHFTEMKGVICLVISISAAASPFPNWTNSTISLKWRG